MVTGLRGVTPALGDGGRAETGGFLDLLLFGPQGPTEEQAEFRRYRQGGGGLSFDQWRASRQPPPAPTPGALSTRTQDILAREGTVEEQRTRQAEQRIAQLASEAEEEAERKRREQLEFTLPPQRVPDEPPTEGYEWKWDGSRYFESPLPGTKPPTAIDLRKIKLAEEKANSEAATEKFRQEQVLLRQGLAERQFEQSQQEQEALQAFRQQQLQPPPISQFQEQQLGLQQQGLEFQRQESQRATELEQQRHLAGLRARPASFLEFAAASGQPPVIQPWMIPLLLANQQAIQQGEELPIQPGQAIPGFDPTAQGFGDLPELIRPSRQFQAQIGPTAFQQFTGFEQARTGAPIEEQLFRLGAAAAPGGRFVGLSRRR